ncbi:hypothetical protein DMUE_3332 [Dictyocoela muelleri]|nr:hypothetical protein DMUE_3332 [Dictyocoela muelleri]
MHLSEKIKKKLLIGIVVSLIIIIIILIITFTVMKNLSLTGNITNKNISYPGSTLEYISQNKSNSTTTNPLTTITETVKEIGETILNGTQDTGIFTNSTTVDPLTTLRENISEFEEKILDETQNMEIFTNSTTVDPLTTITETVKEIGETILNGTQDTGIFTNSTTVDPLTTISERFTKFGEKILNGTRGTDMKINLWEKYCYKIIYKNINDAIAMLPPFDDVESIYKYNHPNVEAALVKIFLKNGGIIEIFIDENKRKVSGCNFISGIEYLKYILFLFYILIVNFCFF